MAAEQAGDLITIFGRVHGAGGVHQLALRAYQRKQPLKQLLLQCHQVINGRWIYSPTRIRVTCQGAQP